MSRQLLLKGVLALAIVIAIGACQIQNRVDMTSKQSPLKGATYNPSTINNSSPPSSTRVYLQYSRKQAECWNLALSKPQISQIEVVSCSKEDLDINTEKLKRLLAEIKSNLNSPTKQSLPNETTALSASKLDELQNTWDVFSKTQCEWESSYLHGNSAAPQAYISCLATMTSERIEHLRLFLCADQGSYGVCPEAQKY